MKFSAFIQKTCLISILLFFLSLPFPLESITNPAFLSEPVFVFVEKSFFGLFLSQKISGEHLVSDSFLMSLHLIFVILISLLSALIWQISSKKQDSKIRLISLVSSYILAFFLIKYGFDKVFKSQFYFPEPNTLYTPLGYLSKDILFWSTMGTSYSYSLFLGIIEIIPGILLLNSRSRKAGAIWAFGVLLHVFVINLSFGITVKLLSGSLVFLCFCALLPYFKELYLFFFSADPLMLSIKNKSNEHKTKLKHFLKFALIFFIFFESMYHAFSGDNFNDDHEPRPRFHGAYELAPLRDKKQSILGDLSQVKRLFIHRRSYLIIQDKADGFHDYPIKIRGYHNFITLNDATKTKIYFVRKKKDEFAIVFYEKGDRIQILAKKIKLNKLPIQN